MNQTEVSHGENTLNHHKTRGIPGYFVIAVDHFLKRSIGPLCEQST